MNIRRILTALFTAAGIIVGGQMSANGAEPLSAEYLTPESQWEFEFRPYAWALFLTGESTLGSNKIDIDTNVIEILGEIDEFYAYMGYHELRKGRFGLFLDLDWARVNFGTSVVKSHNPIAGLNVSLVADADIWFDLLIAEPGISYEIGSRTNGGGSLKDPQASSSTALDVVAGVRYWYMKPDIDLDVTGTISIPALGLSRTGAGSISADTTIDWWDPFIGLRLRHSPSPGRDFFLKGDVGGFGAGSDITWQVATGYSFNTRFLGRDLTSHLGYRAIYFDYEEGSGNRTFGLDMLWHGPVLGLSFKW
jgi:hypothetical protein